MLRNVANHNERNNFKTHYEVNTMTQRELIKRHLLAGYPITPTKALAEYGAWRLAAIIHRLRTIDGLEIETIDKRSIFSGKQYAEYKIREAANV